MERAVRQQLKLYLFSYEQIGKLTEDIMNAITRLPQQFTGPFRYVRRLNSVWFDEQLVQDLVARHRADLQQLAGYYELFCGPRPPPDYDPNSDLPPPAILVMERYFTEKKLRKLLEKKGLEEEERRRALFSHIILKLKEIKT